MSGLCFLLYNVGRRFLVDFHVRFQRAALVEGGVANLAHVRPGTMGTKEMDKEQF